MKRRDLELHPRAHGCLLHHHGARHDVWINPRNAAMSTLPRHGEIKAGTARSICRSLGIALPKLR